MTQNTITAGDSVSAGLGWNGGNDGTLAVQVGPNGAKKTAISINAAGVMSTPQNVVAFSAYQSAAQSLTTGTWTKINLQTKEFDTTSAFDNTTNMRFQPTVSGYYQFSGNISFTGTSPSTTGASIYKNGSAFKQGTIIYTSGPSANQIGVSALIYLNGSSDYVELWGYLAATTPAVLASASATYFQGFLIQPA